MMTVIAYQSCEIKELVARSAPKPKAEGTKPINLKPFFNWIGCNFGGPCEEPPATGTNQERNP